MKHTMIISKDSEVKVLENDNWAELVQQAYLSKKGSRVQYWSESEQDWKDFDFGGEREENSPFLSVKETTKELAAA